MCRQWLCNVVDWRTCFERRSACNIVAYKRVVQNYLIILSSDIQSLTFFYFNTVYQQVYFNVLDLVDIHCERLTLCCPNRRIVYSTVSLFINCLVMNATSEFSWKSVEMRRFDNNLIWYSELTSQPRLFTLVSSKWSLYTFVTYCYCNVFRHRRHCFLAQQFCWSVQQFTLLF
jgi:hypothetical protein